MLTTPFQLLRSLISLDHRIRRRYAYSRCRFTRAQRPGINRSLSAILPMRPNLQT